MYNVHPIQIIFYIKPLLNIKYKSWCSLWHMSNEQVCEFCISDNDSKQQSTKRKQPAWFFSRISMLVGNHQREFIFLVACLLWVRKEIKFGYSCSLGQILHSRYRQSSFMHSAMPRAWDGMSVSLVQDLAEKALVTKLDSYNQSRGCIYIYSL